MTCGKGEANSEIESEPIKPPNRGSERIIRLVSPPPISNTSPHDDVDPPELFLSVNDNDMNFSDRSSDSEVQIVYDGPQGSDVDTIPYAQSPRYASDSTMDSSTICLTPEISSRFQCPCKVIINIYGKTL